MAWVHFADTFGNGQTVLKTLAMTSVHNNIINVHEDLHKISEVLKTYTCTCIILPVATTLYVVTKCLRIASC